MFLWVLFSCQYCIFLIQVSLSKVHFFFFFFFFQTEGRTFPGIRELSPRSEHPRQASDGASKVHNTVAAAVEREGRCYVAVQHSKSVEESSGCVLYKEASQAVKLCYQYC